MSNDNEDNTAAVTDFFTPDEIERIAADVSLLIDHYGSDQLGRFDEIRSQGAAHLIALMAVMLGEKLGVPVPWQMKFLNLAVEKNA